MAEPRFFDTAAAFGRWLRRHAETETELVVGFHKVGTDRPSMRWSESVDEALCVGWIDGVRRRIDAHSYQIRFTPRKAGSIWSAVNIAKFQHLAAAGRVAPAGTLAFGRRTDDRSVVYAYEQAEVATLAPEELRDFKAQDAAWRYFEQAPPGYRKVVLHWVARAKRPATRASRLAKLIAASAAGQRLA